MNPEKQKLIDLVENKRKLFTNVSDQVWNATEVRFDLKKSADVLCDALVQEGFSLERGICGMKDAFIATYGSGGPVVGILGEYDALPEMSQVSGAFEKKCEKEGAGHGCGHQALGAGSLAAAVALKDYLAGSSKRATVKYFGCPAEEGGSGKAYMARDGAFDGVDAFITWHPMTETQIWGSSSLANYQVYFHFKGRSAHAAAAPQHGRSALDACELMNVGVNYLREHIVQEARLHYAYTNSGGKAPNVVQAAASQLYFIRAPKSSQVKEIYERVVDIARGAALMTGTQMEMEWDAVCTEYLVNETLAQAMYKNMVELGPISYTDEDVRYAAQYTEQLGESARAAARAAVAKAFGQTNPDLVDRIASKPIVDDIYPYSVTDAAMSGSTDVGDASWKAPTVQLTVACFPLGTVPHSWQWVAAGQSGIVHKGLLFAGKAMAMTALDIIENPEMLQKAKEEQKKRLGGEIYRCAIPADVVPK